MNKVLMIGRMVAEPELRSLESGVNVCNFRIAVDRRMKDSDGNKIADFFNCTAWRSTADFVGQYGAKGRLVSVEGKLQSRSYKANDGSQRTAIEIQVDNVEFCDSMKNEVSVQNEDTTPARVTEESDDELPF